MLRPPRRREFAKAQTPPKAVCTAFGPRFFTGLFLAWTLKARTFALDWLSRTQKVCLLNSRGQGAMLSVLVASAVGVVVMYSATKNTLSTMQMSRASESVNTEQELVSAIYESLRHQSSCRKNFETDSSGQLKDNGSYIQLKYLKKYGDKETLLINLSHNSLFRDKLEIVKARLRNLCITPDNDFVTNEWRNCTNTNYGVPAGYRKASTVKTHADYISQRTLQIFFKRKGLGALSGKDGETCDRANFHNCFVQACLLEYEIDSSSPQGVKTCRLIGCRGSAADLTSSQECLDSSDCEGNSTGGVCAKGYCSECDSSKTPKACTADADCDSGQTCSLDGYCQRCGHNNICTQSNKCEECEITGDCNKPDFNSQNKNLCVYVSSEGKRKCSECTAINDYDTTNCTNDSSKTMCSAGECVACTKNYDPNAPSGAIKHCKVDADDPTRKHGCKIDTSDQRNNECVQCTENSHCDPTVQYEQDDPWSLTPRKANRQNLSTCDTNTNECVQCLENSDCPGNKPACVTHAKEAWDPGKTKYTDTKKYQCRVCRESDNFGCSAPTPVCRQGLQIRRGGGVYSDNSQVVGFCVKCKSSWVLSQYNNLSGKPDPVNCTEDKRNICGFWGVGHQGQGIYSQYKTECLECTTHHHCRAKPGNLTGCKKDTTNPLNNKCVGCTETSCASGEYCFNETNCYKKCNYWHGSSFVSCSHPDFSGLVCDNSIPNGSGAKYCIPPP